MRAAAIPLDRIALVIGVTGHRDLVPEHEPRLRAEFDALLAALAAANPNTPLVVMTPLSAGAETLAAETAFARGVPVIGCLAMPAAECAAEFAEGESRDRFLAAVADCARVEVASLAKDAARGRFEAAMFVAHHSHLVVAFWDQEPGKGSGGPAEVVNVRMSGVLADGTPLTRLRYAPDAGPVYQIVTPCGGAEPPANAFDTVKLFPQRFYDDEPSENDFAESLRRLDRYNADLTRFDGGAFPATMDGLRERTSAAADGLQRWTFGFLYALYVIAIVATAAQYTSVQWFKYAMFPVAFVAYKVAQRFDYENRYQDYRALSEGLRVQSAWLGAGLRDDQADRCYLGMQQKDLQWIRFALRYAYLAFADAYAPGSVSDARCRDWIDGQTSYFKVKPRREELWLGRLQLASRLTFWAAIAVSIAAFVLLYLPGLPHLVAANFTALAKSASLPSGLAEWLRSNAQGAAAAQTRWDASGWSEAFRTFDRGSPDAKAAGGHHAELVRLSTGALALYAAVALLISNYCDKRGFAQNVRRYERMFVVFDRAKRRLAAMPEPNSEAGREVVRDLGRAALVENADWLLTRRERPLSFVT